MTHAYKFDSKETFLSLGGQDGAEYTHQEGDAFIGVSVIGEEWSVVEGEEPTLVGFLVNTTDLVEAWEPYLVVPSTLMRIFG